MSSGARSLSSLRIDDSRDNSAFEKVENNVEQKAELCVSSSVLTGESVVA